jgi:hypothetical protein
MNWRYVNGSDNGAFKQMTAGNMTNSGYVYIHEQLIGATGPFRVNVDVYKSRTGPDKCVGSSAINPGTVPNVRKYFTTYCGQQSAGKYYLVIWKAEYDGRHEKGSGTLTTR